MENPENLNQENNNMGFAPQTNTPVSENPINNTPIGDPVPVVVPKKKSKAPIIILILLLLAGLAVAAVCLVPTILGNKLSENPGIDAVEPVDPLQEPTEPTTSLMDYSGILQYIYSDSIEPPTIYSVKLNFEDKTLSATMDSSCSAVDCEGLTDGGKVELTETELEGIKWLIGYEKSGILKEQIRETPKTIYDDSENGVLDSFTNALVDIAGGDEIVYVKEGEGEASSILFKAYERHDINGDGTVTKRERGDYLLGALIVNAYSGNDPVNCMPTTKMDENRDLVCKIAEEFNFQDIAY